MSVDQSIETSIDSSVGSPVVVSVTRRTPRQLHSHHGAIATFVFVAVLLMSVIGVVTDATGARATERPAADQPQVDGPSVDTSALADANAAVATLDAGIAAAAARDAQDVQSFLAGLAAPAPNSTPAPAAAAPAATTWIAAPAPEPAVVSDGSRWDQLAQCESGGNWGYPPVSGGFSGGIMFHIGTWQANGGDEFASDAWLASREQQIIVAERVLAGSGWGAWPGCSRRFGWI